MKYLVFRKVHGIDDLSGYDCYHENSSTIGVTLPYIVELTDEEVVILNRNQEFHFLPIVQPEQIKNRLDKALEEARITADRLMAAKDKAAANIAKRAATAEKRQRDAELKKLKELKKKYGE